LLWLIEDVDVALVLGLVCAKVAFDVVARTRNPAAIMIHFLEISTIT
jgi:coenzyme F420-reducing hydrogenase gamma subunit